MKLNEPLWRIRCFGEEVLPSGRTYWFVNQDRDPPSNVSIHYTLQGSLRYRKDGAETRVNPGQACLYNAVDGTEYGVSPEDESYTCLWISFLGAGMIEHWDQIRDRFGSVLTDPDGHLLQLMRDVIQTGSLSGEKDVVSAAGAVHRFVIRLIRLLDQYNGRFQTPVDWAVDRLRANPFYPWSLKELAEEEGCSREHFSRVFRERYQTTPAAWLSQQRVGHARHLLQTTSFTVEDIAHQCGFSGAHGLARTLRRIDQKGPRAIRG